MAVVAAPSRSQHVEMKNFAVELPTGKLMRQALQDANQIARLSAAAGNALTTVLAGFALTTTSWPNIIFFPAFVAGFCLVLILARTGMVNTPDFLTSVPPTSANLPKSFETTAVVSKLLGKLAEVGGTEVKKSGVFTIPGLARIKTKQKPATKAGKKMMFGQEVVIKAKPAKTVVKAFPAAALKRAI